MILLVEAMALIIRTRVVVNDPPTKATHLAPLRSSRFSTKTKSDEMANPSKGFDSAR